MILAIVQARLSSSRLPGKVLLPILGRPMLQRQLERLGRLKRIDKLMVATSDQPDDLGLIKLCDKLGIACFCGSLDDVLDRFYQAAKSANADHIVRLTGDCPLADPELIDEVIAFHLEGDYDYTANTVEPTYPDGLDVAVIRFGALEEAWREAELPSEREHVVPFIWKQPRRFRIGSFKGDTDISHMRWTVDEPEDFKLISTIFETLYPANPAFTTGDILDLLEEQPHLLEINAGIARDEGYQISLEKDRRER